jgi:translation initiation factor 2B subunit (eIF-2B alpha/beta/delta family)
MSFELIRNIIQNTEKSSTELIFELLIFLKEKINNLTTNIEFFSFMDSFLIILKNERKELSIFPVLFEKISFLIEQNKNNNLEDIKGNILKFISDVLDLNRITIENAIKFLINSQHIDRIITLSYSKLVFEVILKLDIKKIYICESRPLFEGLRLANELSSQTNAEIILITDALGPQIINYDIDCVLLGMDSWFSDNSIINKTGSFSLALTAKNNNIPVYVLGNSLKKVNYLSDEYNQINHNENDLKRSYNSIISKKIKILNNYFDIIPANLITKIIDENLTDLQ